MVIADTATAAEAIAETQEVQQLSAPSTGDPTLAKPARPPEAATAAPVEGPAAVAAPAHGPALDREPLLEAIEAVAERVLTAFSQQFAINDNRNKQIDTLHSELTKHRDDLLSRAIAPIVKSLIQLHDVIGRNVETLARNPEAQVSKEEALKLLADLQDEIVLTLARNDVDKYSEENEGHPFDGRRQTVANQRDAETDDQIGKVTVCLRPGFQCQGVIIQKERVVVYRKPAAKPGA